MQHNPPGGLRDFDDAADPNGLYGAWDSFITKQVTPSAQFPAWYDSMNPPNATPPATVAPPWFGMPRRAMLLNKNDLVQAAGAVDAPVAFGTGTDALGDSQPSFKDSASRPIAGPKYRPQDEYLEWVTLKDVDGVVREVWFTCEAPNYWTVLAQDKTLLLKLYARLLGVPTNQIDETKLFFAQDCSQKNLYGGGATTYYKKGDYNPYNDYNMQGAIHLTQGANTLDAEIGLAQAGSLIYGNPPLSSNPDLICCAEYGDPNRNSDPQIGKEVNDLVRQNGMYVTLRDPIGLYMAGIDGTQFTDWNGNAVPNITTAFFLPVRQSPDGTMILRARFQVPTGLMRNGKQARVGDYNYQGHPIEYGGQIANSIRMNLFAQAIPGAPAQNAQKCLGHACFSQSNPSFVVLTPIDTPCSTGAVADIAAHVVSVRAKDSQSHIGSGKPSRVAQYA